MKSNLARYSFSIGIVAASLAACAAPLQSSFNPPKATQGPKAIAAYARSLLYVAGADSVQVLTYPHGKSVGFLGVFGDFVCSDNFGNVFASGAEGIGYVWVFPHGSGTPTATLYNPENPGGCSVDESSENVAVADPDSSPIVIFPHNQKRGWRVAHEYSAQNMQASLYCTYDSAGDLFVDGYNASDSFILVELPKGSSTFTTITLDQVIHSPGSLQWDGNDLVVGDAGASRSSTAVLYSFAISGSSGRKVSTTNLKDSQGAAQFLIYGSTVIGPRDGGGIGFWHFPKGGAPVSTISTYGRPSGEALSLK